MKWHSLLQKARKQAAFTMIELLIVISILGILAVVVLAAIDPIEQINRGRDTGSRSDAEQLISAIDRYYAMKGYYPWQAGATDTAANMDFVAVDDALTGTNTDCPILARLSETTGVTGCTNDSGSQELKQAYVQKISDSNYNSLYVYNAGTVGSSTYVCFMPKSKSFIQEAIDRFVNATTGDAITPPADYPADAVANGTACGTSQTSSGTRDNNCVCLP